MSGRSGVFSPFEAMSPCASGVSIQDGEDTDLRLKSARRLAENAAVLRAQTTPATQVLNIDTDIGQSEGEE